MAAALLRSIQSVNRLLVCEQVCILRSLALNINSKNYFKNCKCLLALTNSIARFNSYTTYTPSTITTHTHKFMLHYNRLPAKLVTLLAGYQLNFVEHLNLISNIFCLAALWNWAPVVNPNYQNLPSKVPSSIHQIPIKCTKPMDQTIGLWRNWYLWPHVKWNCLVCRHHHKAMYARRQTTRVYSGAPHMNMNHWLTCSCPPPLPRGRPPVSKGLCHHISSIQYQNCHIPSKSAVGFFMGWRQ